MRTVFTSVQPLAKPEGEPQHPRAGQAGHVCVVPVDPLKVGVQWDSDGVQTVENVADLRQLGS